LIFWNQLHIWVCFNLQNRSPGNWNRPHNAWNRPRGRWFRPRWRPLG